ncbi:amino acid ABC transporter permease [Paenibacillus alvei]|uniref:amino acid ABC transporter permease n=1 Tax=Paenibacillus alvei TaxID=44250 RepID=UPI0018CEF9DE|nr:amino acid ABC transporter permease [Paenibacillus alvei]MBG9737557.1 polar amino acid ABC transporter permease [Paenibacillus alvei]MBG9747248.1 polar amino acid ABC transporter permease [Paenibacillus alvei]MCY9581270.1 amino acid ABC transporter permease [Paenibacillus alvei]MCY9584440.1 amino acid ABC transporter permease [Paenibacillus alvei]
MTLDTTFMLKHVPDFIHAALVTIGIAGAAIAASLLVAVLNSILYYFRVPVFTSIVRAYTELARNTPLLIPLFFLYFALPSIGIRMSSYTTALLAMTFLGGGYLTEVFRAGIEAVPTSQLESGLALGLSRWQLFCNIVLPQAVRIATPSLFANFIFLLKETTVVSAVAVPEILYTTTNYIALYYKTYEMLLMMTALYLLLFLPLSFVLSWLERRFQHGQFGT